MRPRHVVLRCYNGRRAPGIDLYESSRVLHLIDSGGVYGIERVLLDLLPALQERGVPVLLGCLGPLGSPGCEVGKEAIGKGVPVVFFDERKKISAHGILAIRRTAGETKIGAIHTHGYKANILGGIAGLLTGLPLISTYHCEAAALPELSRYMRIEDFFLRRAHLVLAVSKRIREELVGRGVPGHRTRVVYNGAADRFGAGRRGSGRERSGFSPHLLCVGRLERVKRHDLALDALRRLKAAFPASGLTIAGDGPLAEGLRKRVEETGLASAVALPGFVGDIRGLYDSADIFVLSSDSEGTPMALIEAMSASLPIVSTAVGSIPDVLTSGRDALLVPPNDVDALTRAVASLASDRRLAERLGRNGRRRFEEIFSRDSMAESYVRCYRSVPGLSLGAGNRARSLLWSGSWLPRSGPGSTP